MIPALSFGRYIIMSIDARGYGSLDAQRQQELQADLRRLIDAAAGRAGLHPETWSCQDGGDGELAILPATESELLVVDDYVRHLAHGLRLHNRDRKKASRLRLRLGIHHGPAVGSSLGAAGDGAVHVSRLVSSDQARAALGNSSADLLVILSETVYATVVKPGHTTLVANLFRKVEVKNKELAEFAYFFFPDGAGTVGGKSASKKVRAEGTRSKSARHVVNTKIETAHIGEAVFGFKVSDHD